MKKYKANVKVYDDGTIQVIPSKSTGCSRYSDIFTTRHGLLRQTQKDIIIKFQFPKMSGQQKVADRFLQEAMDIEDFLQGEIEEVPEWQ